jgi:4-hydroxythreonine-4-phosphate dehydrogenase
LGLTVGDPAGIGPEIVLKALAHPSVPEARWRVFGSKQVLDSRAARFGLSPLELIPSKGGASIAMTDMGGDEPPLGIASAEGGRQAAAAAVRAAQAALAGDLDGLVTAPLNKEALRLAGHPWPGHTELLADIARTDDVAMMFVGGPVRVALLTIHTPLQNVSRLVTGELIRRITRLVHRFTPAFGVAGTPRIGIAGLNPHAGENGLMGREESETFVPAIARLRSEGIDVRGPFPADTLFVRAQRGEFDAIIACYHDQGLIPVKLLAFGEAVNVTIGLPFVRTSVDHGTAFDIASQGVADPASLLAAMRLACDLAYRAGESTSKLGAI